MTAFAESLARLLGWRGSRLEALQLGGSLHDVGKISVDASVLCKPGPLTEEELEQIRRHPVTGARLVESFEDFEAALPYVLHHHERWDGFGYPHGLSGERIPLEARLLGVADAFDAMTSARAYRPALRSSRRSSSSSGARARSSIRAGAGVRRRLAPGRDRRAEPRRTARDLGATA